MWIGYVFFTYLCTVFCNRQYKMIQNQRPPICRIAFPILYSIEYFALFERYAAIGYFGSIPFVQGGFILEFCPDRSDFVSVSDVGVRVSASNGIVF